MLKIITRGDNMRISRKKLANAMIDLDLNVTRLAEMSGLTRCTISSIRGGKSCNETTAQKIADALGVKIEEIIEESKR